MLTYFFIGSRRINATKFESNFKFVFEDDAFKYVWKKAANLLMNVLVNIIF